MKRIDNIVIISFICIIMMYLTSFCIINFYGLDLIYDTDMYYDTLIAKLMWEQKTLFPNGWSFGNQFFVIATPVVASVIYGICGNLNLSMSIATLLLTIITMICFIWAAYPKSSSISIICGLLVMLSVIISPEIGKQFVGQLFYLSVSYYSSYIINVLLICGCINRIKRNMKISNAIKTITLFSTFACGMQSMRQTVVIVIPLFMYCLFDRKKELLRFAIALLISNIFGIVLIKIINPLNNSIYGDLSFLTLNELKSKLFYCIYSVYQISGLRWLFKGSIIGIFSLLLLTIYISAIILIGKKNINDNGLSSIIILLSLSVLTILFVCLITKIEINERYIFTWYPLMAFSCIYVFDSIPCISKIRVILSILFIIFSTYNLFFSYGKEVKESLTKRNPIEKQAIEWITDNGYKYIYGKWLGMGKYMYFANGNIIGGSWKDGVFHICSYLNLQNIYSEEDNEKAVYFLYEYQVEECLNASKEKGEKLYKIQEFGDGFIQIFVCDNQLMYKNN